MINARFMGVLETACGFGADLAGPLRRKRAFSLYIISQRFSVEQFHCQVQSPVKFTAIISFHEVRMIQHGDDAHLLLETFSGRFTVGPIGTQ